MYHPVVPIPLVATLAIGVLAAVCWVTAVVHMLIICTIQILTSASGCAKKHAYIPFRLLTAIVLPSNLSFGCAFLDTASMDAQETYLTFQMGLQLIINRQYKQEATITSHLRVLIFVMMLYLFQLIILTETPQLLDTRCMDDRTSDADTTDSRASFRDRLKDRDGTCIITDAPPLLCEGFHYYPHSKGSEVRPFA